MTTPLGYLNVHSNCSPVTFTTSSWLVVCSFLTSTTPPATANAITMMVGTTVQMISSVVLPWMGGPSRRSSGRARQRHTE